MNFARLNHILIPTTKKERDRMRKTRAGRLLASLFSGVLYFSEEGRWGLLLWFIAGAVSLNVGTTQFYFLFSGLTALLISVLLLARRFHIRDVSIQIDAPQRIAVGEPLSFVITLFHNGKESHHAIRIHTPFLPWDGKWIMKPDGVGQLLGGQTERKSAKALFSERGAHHLDPFHATQLLPLGLSNGPAIHSRGTRFMVVPKIADIVSLTLPLKSRYQPGGVALASATGESRELLGLRPYRPGDPIRDIHAAGWARLGEPVVREYRQEYFTRIGIVVDTDETVFEPKQFEAALSLAAGFVSYLNRGDALIDLVVFGDRVHTLMVGRHLGFLDQALDLLACAQTASPWSLAKLQRRTADHLRCLSALLFITPSWDEKRQALRQFAAASGVGFRAFLVASEEKRKVDGVTAVSLDHINQGRVAL